jgi:hypothetical protein
MTDTTTKTVTAEDADMAYYFIREKDEVTRWCDWNERREVLCAAVPELDDYLRTQRTADALKSVALEKLQALRDQLEVNNG